MRKLLCCTCLTPILAAAMPASGFAQTVIDEETTTPVRTSTANGGTADDILIDEEGSIVPEGGVAVTVDSDNDVTNEGEIGISDADDATGILVEAGRSGTITNDGTITLDEDYEPEDEDDDGDIDGPFAEGERRFGIRLGEGGAYTGSIVNGGAVEIAGNRSAGIALDSDLNGDLVHSGSIEVVGDDSYGIRTQNVSGDMTVSGSVTARGENVVGVAVDGDIGGALIFQNSVAVTGYRSTTAPSDTEDLDEDDLLQGGSAIRITGNVDGGILFDIAPADNDEDEDDEDDDGVPDNAEGDADIIAYGEAPAVSVGSGDDIQIGAVSGDESGHGLSVRGRIRGVGVYEDVDAAALVLGGQGGAVDVAGGIGISGTVSATSDGGNAVALRLAEGASTPELVNSGSIRAGGGNAEGTAAEAVAIESGASLSEIRNSGAIEAVTAEEGTAYAIVDRSGTVGLVVNDRTITARGGEDGRNIAIDLSANDGGAIIRQSAAEEGGPDRTIQGDIRLGGGADLLEVLGGTVSGDVVLAEGDDRVSLGGDALLRGSTDFGAGDDALAMTGASQFAGDVNFGTGASTLSLSGESIFRGAITHDGSLAVDVAGGTLELTNSGAVSLASLNVGAEGTIGVTVDPEAESNTLYDVAGTATFEEGAALSVRLTQAASSEGEFVVVRADSLVGADTLEGSAGNLPFLFDSRISVDEEAGEVSLSLARKTAEALGLNGSQTRAYDAVFEALDNDADVAGAFLNITDGEAFRETLRQMLPDHAGGSFEAVSLASRQMARILTDPDAPYVDRGRWGYWLQQGAWGTSSDFADTAAYDISGWGASGGAELNTETAGSIGLSIAYLSSEIDDDGTANEVIADQYEGAVHWRGTWDGFLGYARASLGYITYDSERRFSGIFDGEEVTRIANGERDAWLYSASGGASYEVSLGRLRLRPIGTLDYYRLKEDGYTDTGGGDAFNLDVDSRTSDELAATGRLVAALTFGGENRMAGWGRVEAEGGRREILSGSLGATTVRFTNGEDFTLIADERTDGWVFGLRALGGNDVFTLGGEVNAEEQQGRYAVAGRLSLRMGF